MVASTQLAARLGSMQAAVEELDLGALGRALWRRKAKILALTLGAAAIAFIGVSLITPRYKSETRVLIESRESGVCLKIRSRLEQMGFRIEAGVRCQQGLVLSAHRQGFGQMENAA